jgi:hypothetical protein
MRRLPQISQPSLGTSLYRRSDRSRAKILRFLIVFKYPPLGSRTDALDATR